MKRLLMAIGILFFSARVHAGSGVVGSLDYLKLWNSSYVQTAQLGILSSGCVVIGGFKVADSTGNATVNIGFYAANSTGFAMTQSQTLIATYTVTSENDGMFNAKASTGGVYNITRPNAGVTIPGIVIYWDYLSPTCMPRQLR